MEESCYYPPCCFNSQSSFMNVFYSNFKGLNGYIVPLLGLARTNMEGYRPVFVHLPLFWSSVLGVAQCEPWVIACSGCSRDSTFGYFAFFEYITEGFSPTLLCVIMSSFWPKIFELKCDSFENQKSVWWETKADLMAWLLAYLTYYVLLPCPPWNSLC